MESLLAFRFRHSIDNDSGYYRRRAIAFMKFNFRESYCGDTLSDELFQDYVSDLAFNQRKLAESGFLAKDMALLLSFPRSGNGWIRIILATFFASETDSYVAPDALDKVSYYSLEPELGFPTRALQFVNGRRLAIDAYVPDLYQHARLKKSLSDKRIAGLIRTKPKTIFKTHHLVSTKSDFRSIGILLRTPEECVVSAAVLRYPKLLDCPASDVGRRLEELIVIYKKYLKAFESLAEQRRTFLISIVRPEKHLARWLKFQYEDIPLEVEEIEEKLLSITSVIPLRSRYKEVVQDRVDISSIDGYGSALELYESIVSRTV